MHTRGHKLSPLPQTALSIDKAEQDLHTGYCLNMIRNDSLSVQMARLMAALVLPSVTAFAADWPQWGGTPARNMYSPETNLPVLVSPGSVREGNNDPAVAPKCLHWKAKLGSQSYGNVTVARGKVFVGTNNDFPRDPQHEGDRSILLCLDEQTGEFLWQLVIPKLAAGKVNDYESLGVLSSSTVDGNRVYIVTSRCEVMCLDIEGMANGNDGPFTAEADYMVKDVIVNRGQSNASPAPPAKVGPKDADIIWVYDMMDELGAFPHNAANSSVLVDGDIVYVCTSNGQDWTHSNVPSPVSPSVIALDKKTGRLLGEDDAGSGPRVFHGQWSSPALGEVDGRKLVFFGGGDGWCYAFDAHPVSEAGQALLKTVWKFNCNPPEYLLKDGQPIKYGSTEGPSEVDATPVFYKNRVYVATGQDPEQGDGVGRLVCIDATGTGDLTQKGLVWDFKKIHRSLSTVSIDPATGLLFVADFSGMVYCLDADSGRLYWQHDLKSAIWGSTLIADGKVYVGNEDGDLVVFAASKEKQVLTKNRVDGREQNGINFGEPLYGTPVAANGSLYIQTHTRLYSFQNKKD